MHATQNLFKTQYARTSNLNFFEASLKKENGLFVVVAQERKAIIFNFKKVLVFHVRDHPPIQ